MKNIDITLDIMALGAGYNNPTGRTGIFRVVENLVKGLSKSPQCNLSFISTHFEKESKKYLKEILDLNQNDLQYPKSSDFIINKINNYLINHQLQDKKGINFIVNNVIPYNNLKKLAYRSDVYHSPYMPIPAELKSVSKIKKFLTVHDLIPILYPQYFEKNNQPLIKNAIESLEEDGYAICVSQSTKDDLCNYTNINPNQVFVSHLAASHDKFYPQNDKTKIEIVRKKYGIGIEDYFLSVSTIEPRKNILHVINSFTSLINSGELKDVNLVLAGTKGWDFKDVFDQINNSDIKKKIIVTGFVDDEDLASLYSGALAFVYPSLYEGFGLPVLEAMQCGKPVITSNISSLPEVIEDAGILISPKDPDELCQAMLDLYRNVSLRNELANKAILQSKKFTWENCINQNIDAYKFALNR